MQAEAHGLEQGTEAIANEDVRDKGMGIDDVRDQRKRKISDVVEDESSS